MLLVENSRIDVAVARVICEAVIIILITLEPMKNSYLRKFMQRLIPVFILEELFLITYASFLYFEIYGEWDVVVWRSYEIIRIFISLSLCYPMSLCIGETGEKLQRLFLVVTSLVVVGAISDHLHLNNGHSGFNYIAFMLIFLFTFQQILNLRRQSEVEIPRLKSLMIIELVLIILNGCLIIFFFIFDRKHPMVSSIKITICFLQYHKIYLIISVMTFFD